MSIKGIPFGLKLRHFSLCFPCQGQRLSRCRTLGITLTSGNDQERKTDLFCLPCQGPRLSRCRTLGIALTSGNDQEWTSGDSRPVPSTMSVERIQQKGAVLSLYKARVLNSGRLHISLCCIRELVTFVLYQSIGTPSTIASHSFRRTVASRN